MSCSIIRSSSTGEVSAVLAPNSKRSRLYDALLDRQEVINQVTKEQALQNWAVVYTPGFTHYSGDWQTNPDATHVTLDENGEPVLAALDAYLLENGVQVSDIAGLVAPTQDADRPDVQTRTGFEPQLHQVISRMQALFPQLRVEEVSSERFNALTGGLPGEQTISPKAFTKGGIVYIPQGSITPASIVQEEFLHPFVSALYQTRRPLFVGLYNELVKTNPELIAQVAGDYTDANGFSEQDRQHEIVTRALQQTIPVLRAAQDGPNTATENDTLFTQLARRFLTWLRDILGKLGRTDLRSLDELSSDMNLQDLSDWLLSDSGGVDLSGFDTTAGFYHLGRAPEEADTDDVIEQQYNSRGQQRKIDRLDEQISLLDSLLKRTKAVTTSQRETIKKLRESQLMYRKLLEEGSESTRSVTTFIGTSDLPAQPGSEVYANLGTFLHGIMEELQKRALDSPTRVVPAALFSRELFDSLLKSNTTPFEIKNLNADALYPIASEMVSYLSPYYANGAIVLPEMSVFARSSAGVGIIGRIDFSVLSKDGSIKLVDLKTTKYADKRYQDHLERPYQLKNIKDGADELFVNLTPDRSKLINYHAQLSVYEQMLRQNGIKVSGKDVLGVFMAGINQPTPTGDTKFVFRSAQVVQLRAVQYAFRMDKTTGEVTKDRRYTGVERAAKQSIPVEGDVLDNPGDASYSQASQGEGSRNEFSHLSSQTLTQLVDQLVKTTEQSIATLDKEIRKADDFQADPAKQEYYRNRRAQLIRVQETLLREGLTPDLKLQVSTSALLTDYAIVHNRVEALVKNTALPLDEQMKAFLSINKQSVHHRELFELFKQSLLSAYGETKKTDADYKLIAEIDHVLNGIEMDQMAYFKLGREVMFQLIREQNPEGLTDEMFTNIKGVLEAQERHLGKRLVKLTERLKQPTLQKTYWMGTLKYSLGMQDEETLRKQTQTELDYTTARLGYLRDELKNDGKLTDTKIREYIAGLFENPASQFYLGSRMGEDVLGYSSDDFYSANLSPELLLATVAGYLRTGTIDAQRKFSEDAHSSNWKQTTREFLSRYGSPSDASAQVSESVTQQHRNADGTRSEAQTHRAFINPIGENLRQYVRDHRFSLQDKYDELKALKDEQGKLAAPDEKLVEAIKNKRTEIANQKKDYLAWRRQYTHMELKDELYEMTLQLPDDVQEELEEIDSRVQSIYDSKGYNNEEELGEDELDTIQLLKIRRREVMKRATENNPEYEKMLEKYDQYFTQDINWDLFTRHDNAKKSFFLEKNNPDGYQKWRERNMVTKPKQEWHDELNDLYTKLAKLVNAEDPVLSELLLEQRTILRKYKIDGEFDARYLTDADVRHYEYIEEKIAQMREVAKAQAEEAAKAGSKKTKAEAVKARQRAMILNKIDRMRQKELNKPYQRERAKRVTRLMDEAKSLKLYYDQWQAETDPVKKAALADLHQANEKLFLQQEQEFKNWYDRFNSKPYTLGLARTGKPIPEMPKKFLYSYKPSSESDYVTEPGSKYRLRRHKPEALNPEYQASVDGYPMPKGLRLNEATNRFEITGDNPYINPRFVTMSKDKSVYDFYNYLVMDNYIGKQKNISGRKLGFLYPGVQETGVEDVLQNKQEGLSRQWKEVADSWTFKTSAQEAAKNEYGQSGDLRVKFAYNYAMPAELTTRDGINAVLKWNLGARVNQAMADADLRIAPIVDTLENMLSQMKSDTPQAKKMQKLLDHVRYERDKLIYGQTMAASQKEVLGKLDNTWLNRRNLKVLFKAISFTRLGFDLPLQAGNLLSGNVQAFLSTSKLRHVTEEDYGWAKMELYSKAGVQLLRDYGQPVPDTFYGKFYWYLNPLQKDPDKMLDLSSQSVGRRILNRALAVGDLGFAAQDKGELEIGMTTALMVYHGSKYKKLKLDTKGNPAQDAAGMPVYELDEKGNVIYLHGLECFYENKTGGLSRRTDVEFTENDEKLLRNRVYNEIIQVQGNYSDYTKSRAESFLLGQLLLFYRKYVPSVLSSRFGGFTGDVTEHTNWQTGELQMGWYTALVKMVEYYGPGETFKALIPAAVRDKLGISSAVAPFLLSKKNQAVKELIAATICTLLYAQMRSSVMDGDDDDDMNWFSVMAMKTLIKVFNETRSVVPIPGIGKPDEYINIFTNFTTATREFKTLFGAATHLFLWSVDSDEAYYKKKTGRFEEGDAKAVKDLQELSGLDNFINLASPEDGLKQALKQK